MSAFANIVLQDSHSVDHIFTPHSKDQDVAVWQNLGETVAGNPEQILQIYKSGMKPGRKTTSVVYRLNVPLLESCDATCTNEKVRGVARAIIELIIPNDMTLAERQKLLFYVQNLTLDDSFENSVSILEPVF